MGIYTPKPLKGLRSLSDEERRAYIEEQIELGKLTKKWRFSDADRLYKNQQFKAKFKDAAWDKITDKSSSTYIPAAQRDELYDRDEYTKAILSKYGNDEDVGRYSKYTTEGLKDLWESNILNEDELKQEEERLKSTSEINKDNAWKPKSRLLAALANTTSGPQFPGEESPTSLKDISNAIAYNRGILSEEEKKKVDSKVEKAVMQGEGYVTQGRSEQEIQSAIKSLYEKNLKKKEDLQRRESKRILESPSVRREVLNRVTQLYEDINDGKVSYEEVDKVFTDTYDNDTKDEPYGSRYYTGYKNRSELSNLTIDDKIRTLAEMSVLSEAFGDPAQAMQTIDDKFFYMVKDNQSWLKRRGNVLRGTAAKANGFLANYLLSAPAETYHAMFDNAQEYKEFKTAEKSLEKGGISPFLNPNYWNLVDQYGVWSPSEVSRISHNGGIGGAQNLYSPTGEMTAAQFADEGFKMLGYMLPGAVIGALTRKVPRTSGWAKVIAGTELIGSAASLGSAYSSGVYNDVVFKADQILDEMFDKEASGFIEKYYNQHPNYIEDYFKAHGISKDDPEVLKTPAILNANRELYEAAKEEYFKENESRRKFYEDAYERALQDAKRGSVADFSLETARMLVSNAFWGKWTRSQLTRDVLNKGKINPINISRTEDGALKAAQTAGRGVGRAHAAALSVINGGVDNWLDDITAGVGKGLGLGYFNNYVASRYNPDAFVEGARMSAGLLDGMYWGMQGADEAFKDKQTWIDGALGAVGGVLGARLNAITLAMDAIRHEGLFANEGNEKSSKEAKEEWKNMTTLQKINRYVTNGVLTSMADADVQFANTEEFIKNLNENILPKYKDAIQEVGTMLKEQIDFDTLETILDAKDAKQLGMLASIIRMENAYKDPLYNQIPEIQKFGDYIQRGKKGNFTYEELQSYINDPANITVKNSENPEQRAAEAMQKNINNFLKIAKSYDKISKNVKMNDNFNALSDIGKTQIAVQLTLNELWKERLASMQESLGTKGTEKSPMSFEAEFGSREGQEAVLQSLNDTLREMSIKRQGAIQNVKVFEDAIEKSTDPKERQFLLKKYNDAVFAENYYKQATKELKNLIRERSKKRANNIFDDAGYARTLSKEEIMRLSPKQRAEMLKPENAFKYSTEQKAIINELKEELKNHTDNEGKTQDLLQVVYDAGVMQDRVQSSEDSIRKVTQHPLMLASYISRVKERQNNLILRAVEQAYKKEMFAKFDTLTNPQEAIDTIFRGEYKEDTVSNGFFALPDYVESYIKDHPEAKDVLSEAAEMVDTLDTLFGVTESLFEKPEADQLKKIIAQAVRPANSKAEMMSSLEDLIDIQSDSQAKLQFDRILEKAESVNLQRDVTKVRNRKLERQKKQEAEIKRLEAQKAEEAKKDGKNFGFDNYKVGDTIYNKQTGKEYTVVGFEEFKNGTTRMLVENLSGNKKSTTYLSQEQSANYTKSLEEISNNSKEDTTKTEKSKDDTSTEIVDKDIKGELDSGKSVMTDITEAIEIDAEGAIQSPSAETQAQLYGGEVIAIPEKDITDQGNEISSEADDLLSGNRFPEYSVEGLKQNTIRYEVPESDKSIFGRLRKWLDSPNTKEHKRIKLQEIIDEEFGRMLSDNPNLKIRFMMMKQTETDNPLQKSLLNVVELSPEMRKKYHDESRGGIIEANGKVWLLVGFTSYPRGASQSKITAYNNMKAPISLRRLDYFKAHPDESHYVDPIAYTQVQRTTSGRLIKETEGSERKLRTIDELAQQSGVSVSKLSFGIQTKEVENSGFVVTNNAGSSDKIFPPKRAEDNRGRAFILVETPTGNKIPAALEPVMYNSLQENSPLRTIIESNLSKLLSSNYDVRAAAIRELCGYLVLGAKKNILIGTKDINTLTLRIEGAADITYKLGKNVDIAKFFNDVVNADFQVNVTLNTFSNPAMFKIYRDSNALQTNIERLKTAGMSYNVYMTDSQGKPIMNTPYGNAIPGTGKVEVNTSRAFRVSDLTIEYKNGEFINRNTGKVIDPNSALGESCKVNLDIITNNWQPIYKKGGLEYYDKGGKVFTRDESGKIEYLSEEEAKNIKKTLSDKIESKQRAENLQEVVFEDLEEPVKEVSEVELSNPEDISVRALLEEEEITDLLESPSQQPADAKEIIKEEKESQPAQAKEVISGVGTKTLSELQNTENLSTFEKIVNNPEYTEKVYEALFEKNWGITGDLVRDAEVLKTHNVSVVGIDNIESWLDLIKHCR